MEGERRKREERQVLAWAFETSKPISGDTSNKATPTPSQRILWGLSMQVYEPMAAILIPSHLMTTCPA